MSFFDTDEDKKDEAEVVEEKKDDGKVMVGDQEFDQKELAGIVGNYKKIEKDYGSVDKLTSSWGTRGQKIGALEKELSEIKENQATAAIEDKKESGAELSQMMSWGSTARARAMQMRWRWPPENSCG